MSKKLTITLPDELDQALALAATQTINLPNTLFCSY